MTRRICLVFGTMLAATIVAAIAISIYAPGSLRIESIPTGANVTIDGKNVSQSTPCTISGLRPGKHFLVIAKEGYHPTERSTSITAFRSSALSLTLRQRLTTGSLSITSSPQGAVVVLDGHKTGFVTPTTIDRLKPGSHIVILQFAGYEAWSETFSVKAEQTVAFTPEMKRLSERIIACEKGGTVLIDPSSGIIESLNPDVRADLYAVTASGKLIAAVTEGLLSSFTIMDNTGTVLRRIDIERPFRSKWGHMMTGFNAVSWHPDGRTLLLSVATHPATDAQSFLLAYDMDSDSLRAVSHYVPTGRLADDLTRIARGLKPQPHTKCTDSAGAYSPDGKLIAFIRDGDVYVADAADLGHPVVLSQQLDTAKLSGPVLWRPDGKAVLCFVQGPQQAVGYVLSLTGEKLEQLDGILPQCAWSPDGTRLAAVRNNASQREFGILEVRDRSWQRLEGEINSRPVWACLKKAAGGSGILKVVTATPGAKVFIDGELTGKITPFNFNLPAGAHTVSVQRKGQTSDPQSFVVIAGKTVVAQAQE